jgi:hypothetical protein
MDQEIKFTNKDILAFCDRLKGCEDALKNLNDETLKNIKESLDRIEKNQNANICRTDERLDKLENWRSYVAGALFIISFVVGIMGKTMWDMYVQYPHTIQAEVKAEIESIFNKK